MKIKQKLYRDSANGMIAGVCAGLAKYFKVDVYILRFIWIILALFFGSGIFIYLAAILIIPKEPHLNNEIEMVDPGREKKLSLKNEDKIVAGVCAGIADFYDIDVSIIRFLFIILTFIYGIGLIIYILFLIFLTGE